MLSEDALIIIAVESSVAVLIALLFLIIGFCCGRLRLKGHAFSSLRKPIRPPRLRESYYNMPPSEQHNMELREQKNELQIKQDPATLAYDDVVTPGPNPEPNSPEKSHHHIMTYDDILPPRKQDIMREKPKVMYDEVLPPHEQDSTSVELKKNIAYYPADLK